jgi:hypothetical protein
VVIASVVFSVYGLRLRQTTGNKLWASGQASYVPENGG